MGSYIGIPFKCHKNTADYVRNILYPGTGKLNQQVKSLDTGDSVQYRNALIDTVSNLQQESGGEHGKDGVRHAETGLRSRCCQGSTLKEHGNNLTP